MSNISKSVGKPSLSDKEIDLIFRKLVPRSLSEVVLEPYLRAGLSLHAACFKADVPKSTVYDLYAENKEIAKIIDVTRHYFIPLVKCPHFCARAQKWGHFEVKVMII